jgi:hypothetical protein
MKNRPTTPDRGWIVSFVRVIRAFAEGSLAVLAAAIALLLIGIPIALIVRGLHEGLSWTVRLAGEMSAGVEALVSVVSVVGGLVIALVAAGRLMSIAAAGR